MGAAVGTGNVNRAGEVKVWGWGWLSNATLLGSASSAGVASVDDAVSVLPEVPTLLLQPVAAGTATPTATTRPQNRIKERMLPTTCR
ncbi:hypothetical protein GCM10022402_36380 [Salinactinospora qingdaonensis]|uniref:Regulator of chromosome condensation (RCC1) repeat-containing protein n=1 Tax=Salinactinospora qingdaonensis TaxID=702744 RepID=A0ABP7G4M4_9ACTN